ncbi:apoptosis regulator BAX-like [Ruditapes philippinarum]|uniref:apoptosis regulator BAX-like n=1 Tax=Ruditapes philippinarum TaxID=129788 RepID=UPI00295C2529|nr:apoptosis regulator BAX-like [Ruditapes philippinarum]
MSFKDHPLALKRPYVKRQLSRDDIGNQGRVLLNEFIHDRLYEDHVECIPAVDELQEPGTPSGPPLEHMREIARALRCIADELDQDQRIQRIISKVPPDAPQQTFFNVANDFFRDGIISWGRVATLFYFGYKMALKALDKIPLIKAIINWVINFIVDQVAPWIIERGGWEMIVEYFGTPGWQATGIFVGGFAVAGAIVAYNVWGH